MLVGSILNNAKNNMQTGGVIAAGLGLISDIANGRQYTSGQYRLGEKYLKHIHGEPINSYQNVPDEIYPEAVKFFTAAFGVPVSVIEDLNALQDGVEAYYRRPEKKYTERAAVERAVYLKQNFSQWDRPKWEIGDFSRPVPAGATITENKAAGLSFFKSLLAKKSGAPQTQTVALSPVSFKLSPSSSGEIAGTTEPVWNNGKPDELSPVTVTAKIDASKKYVHFATYAIVGMGFLGVLVYAVRKLLKRK